MTDTRERGDVTAGYFQERWYAVVNDLVGGWAVATVDRPLSEIDTKSRTVVVVADFVSEEAARYIATLHNLNKGFTDVLQRVITSDEPPYGAWPCQPQ